MQATILGVIFDSPLPLSATSNPPARPIDPTLAAHPGSNHGSPLHCYHFGPRRGSSLLDYLKSPPDWRPLLAPARFCLVSKCQKYSCRNRRQMTSLFYLKYSRSFLARCRVKAQPFTLRPQAFCPPGPHPLQLLLLTGSHWLIPPRPLRLPRCSSNTSRALCIRIAVSSALLTPPLTR